MKFHRSSNFKHRDREPRYFVGYLLPESFGYAEGYRYQVQLLSEDGGADARGRRLCLNGCSSTRRRARHSGCVGWFKQDIG